VVYEEEQNPGPVLRKVRGWPLVRGVFVLWDTLVLGTRSLIFSANVSLQEDDEELEGEEPAALTGFFLWLTLGISLLFAVGLFVITMQRALTITFFISLSFVRLQKYWLHINSMLIRSTAHKELRERI
jgi:uncharacterized protein YqhQ